VTLGGLATAQGTNTLNFFNARATITDTNMLGGAPITLGGSTLAFRQASVNFFNPLNILSTSTLMVTNGTNFCGTLNGPGLVTLSALPTRCCRWEVTRRTSAET